MKIDLENDTSQAAQMGVLTRPRMSEVKSETNRASRADEKIDSTASIELTKLMDASAKRLAAAGTNVAFNFDRSTNLITVRVHDPKTGDLIRQIPPQAFIRITENIDRFLGLLVDHKS